MAKPTLWKTPPGVLSFPHLFKPQPPVKPGGKAKFSCAIIWDADAQKDPKYIAIRDEVAKLIAAKWPNGVPANLKIMLKKGADKPDLEGYGEGKMYVQASAEKKVALVDGKMRPILVEDDLYPGCKVVLSMTIYVFEAKSPSGAVISRGVTFGLRGVQKVGDGERLGAGGDPGFEEVPGYEGAAPAGVPDGGVAAKLGADGVPLDEHGQPLF